MLRDVSPFHNFCQPERTESGWKEPSLAERLPDSFDQAYRLPLVLLTYKVKAEQGGGIPAPTHVDGTGRLKTVNREQNSIYLRLN